MFGISGFFKNIKNAFTKEVVLRTDIRESIKRQTNIDVPIENITCKNGVVGIKGLNPSATSVIFIKKQKILEELQGKETTKFIKDVR